MAYRLPDGPCRSLRARAACSACQRRLFRSGPHQAAMEFCAFAEDRGRFSPTNLAKVVSGVMTSKPAEKARHGLDAAGRVCPAAEWCDESRIPAQRRNQVHKFTEIRLGRRSPTRRPFVQGTSLFDDNPAILRANRCRQSAVAWTVMTPMSFATEICVRITPVRHQYAAYRRYTVKPRRALAIARVMVSRRRLNRQTVIDSIAERKYAPESARAGNLSRRLRHCMNGLRVVGHRPQ